MWTENVHIIGPWNKSKQMRITADIYTGIQKMDVKMTVAEFYEPADVTTAILVIDEQLPKLFRPEYSVCIMLSKMAVLRINDNGFMSIFISKASDDDICWMQKTFHYM